MTVQQTAIIPPSPIISLVPWDPDSVAHVERMTQQRISCGWKAERVPYWQQFQRDGKLALFWVVLTPYCPGRDALIQKHLKQFPNETEALEDSSMSVLARERTPYFSQFNPIGHICLDGCIENHDNDRLMISPADGIYTLAAFYVSSAMQRNGIGSVVMSTLEVLAVEDYGAKSITLDTISKEDIAADNPGMIACNRTVPNVVTLDWYQRRGYVIYNRVKDALFDVDATGKKWGVTLVYLKKDLT